jgi:prevent-host-death family protein
MLQVNIHEAKTNLSRLLERVTAGEEVVIARAGRPIARLLPWEEKETPRQLGLFAGQIQIHEDFDDLPDDMRALFEGEGP